jgi:thiamine pyrophosphokinase
MSRSRASLSYDALLVADGSLPSGRCLRALIDASRRTVALDGAANQLSRRRLRFDIILGDLDSISPSTLKSAARRRITILRVPEQETPDLDKGLRLCQRRRWKRVCIVGFLGPRLDHSLNALGAFAKYDDLELTLVTSQSIGRVVHGRAALMCTVRPGLRLSLMPTPMARGVILSGVRWPLRRRTLRQGGFVSLSNEAIAPVVTMRQASGCSIFIAQRRRDQISLDFTSPMR